MTRGLRGVAPAPRLVAALLAASLLAAARGATPAAAQQAEDSVTVDHFRAPASPAFVLLGIEPLSVERPGTPQGFAATILSATNQATLLPRNYALEVAPYWLARHPTLSFRDYYHASTGQTLLQTLALSFATATPDTGAAGTAVGLGLRALLAQGRAPEQVKAVADSIRTLQLAIAELVPDEGDPDPATLARMQALADSIADLVQRLDVRRVGFRLELAAASTFQFPGDRFEDGELRRLGFWVTSSYLLPHPRLDVTGVVRLLANVSGPESGAFFDVGGRLSLEHEKLQLSLEYVFRAAVDASFEQDVPGQFTGTITLDNTYRLSGSAEYLIGNGTSLVAVLGRNYSPRDAPNLIATAAVNLGFGALPFVAPGR